MRNIAKVSRATMDATAFIVAISVLMLLVSYMAAARLYGMSHLIPYGVLLVSCFLLLESLAVGCYSLLSGPIGEEASKDRPIQTKRTQCRSQTGRKGETSGNLCQERGEQSGHHRGNQTETEGGHTRLHLLGDGSDSGAR